jgi:hypothetical protein
VRDLRLDSDGVVRAAEQRALRIILLLRGEHEEIKRLARAGEFSSFKLDEGEEQLEGLLTLSWMDGAATAAKAMLKHPDAWQE